MPCANILKPSLLAPRLLRMGVLEVLTGSLKFAEKSNISAKEAFCKYRNFELRSLHKHYKSQGRVCTNCCGGQFFTYIFYQSVKGKSLIFLTGFSFFILTAFYEKLQNVWEILIAKVLCSILNSRVYFWHCRLQKKPQEYNSFSEMGKVSFSPHKFYSVMKLSKRVSLSFTYFLSSLLC